MSWIAVGECACAHVSSPRCQLVSQFERENGTEMAALCPGVQYGLSSQENFGENKDLVFVKLTDSAYRAIEEYLRLQKQNKHLSRTPTIKFLGSEGQLSFPSSSTNNSNGTTTSANNSPSVSTATSITTFSFSLSSTTDMEGPGGSFECVQQRQSLATAAVTSAAGPRSAGTLAGLGPMAHKLRVHATDDVYEETRKRMTFADKVQKNKCTREIKPNQTDIGRKVKVKQQQQQLHHHQVQLSAQSAAHQPVATSIGRSGNSGGANSGSSNNNMNMRRSAVEQHQTASALVDRTTTAAAVSTMSSATAAISSSTAANSVANNLPLKHQSGSPFSPSLNNTNNHSNSLNSSGTNLYNSGNNGLLDRIGGGGSSSANSMQQRLNGQGLRSNHVSSSKSIKQSMNSIGRRPLRERLIQLLALRPFKKIEILERLNKEGLRERNGISSVLKQVATSKDNCYYLNRVMWNDVQEDWPFYSEEEKQVLKRRKPQNLTPPGGSDGGSSTGSGNSPTSTHPGSPPSTTTTMSTAGRHRVSHLSANQQQQQPQHRDKDRDGGGGAAIGGSAHPMQTHGGGYRPPATVAAAAVDNGRRQQALPVDRRHASGMNPRSRQLGGGVDGGGYGVGKRHLSDDDDVVDEPDECGRGGGGRKRLCDSHILSFGVNRDPKTWNPDATTLPQQQQHTSPTSKPPTYHHPHTFDSLCDTNTPLTANHTSFPSSHQHHHQSRTTTPKQPTPLIKPQQQTIVTDDYQQSGNSSVNWNWNSGTNSVGNAHAHAHAQQQRVMEKQLQQQQRKEVAVRVSPDSQSDRIDRMQRSGERAALGMVAEAVGVVSVADEYDDYVREYTSIGDLEQRRRYKSDFNAVYDEYKELHGVVESVSRRFQILDERLKGEPTNKTPKYNEIKEQIMREYKQTKNNEQHQNAKRRFEYLHRKLSHIKDLVTQYDQQIQLQEDQQQTAATTNSY